MQKYLVRTLCAIAVATVCSPGYVVLASSLASAQIYPSRPVRIVVPFPPGGPLDLIGRAIADRMQADLKQPFIIENKAGAGGNLGSDAVAKSDPDGYTLLLGLSSTTTANPWIYGNFPFDPAKDLAPISIVATYSQTLVVHPSLPVKTVKEFVDYARNNAVSYANGGIGSPGHLLMELFKLKANFPAISVPYRGNAPLVVDLLSGEVKSGFVAAGGMIQNIRDGKLRGLAISTKERSPQLADVPTIAEAGYPEVLLGGYMVLHAPAGTLPAIVELLQKEVQSALADKTIQERARRIEVDPVPTTSAEATRLLLEERELMKQLVQSTKMRID